MIFDKLAILFLLALTLQGDPSSFPTDYFRSPLGIPILLSGNFAEMRSNHFHSGLDIKTQGKEGYRVYAAAEGWISRIRVSPWGYGHALYIEHPNGFTTVYGHLQQFKAPLDQYVRAAQYQKKQFSVDLYPEKGILKIEKGQVVALSGNTGGSGGPHLHFEIRDTATQEPLNPLLFGLPFVDQQPPKFFKLKIYALDASSYLRIQNEQTGTSTWITKESPVVVDLVQNGTTYTLKKSLHLSGTGTLGFSIQAHDSHDGSNNRLGVYRISLTDNEIPLFSSEMTRFSFGETRYLNAHIDYQERIDRRRWLQRTYLIPGNALSLYETTNRGALHLRPDEAHQMRFRIEDATGNAASLQFNITGAELDPPAFEMHEPEKLVKPSEPLVITETSFILEIPEHTFYDEVAFKYHVTSDAPSPYSDVHHVLDKRTPAHKRFTLSVKPTNMPTSLNQQALLAKVDEKGNISSIGGTYEQGWISATTNTFGSFFVTVDTLAPTVSPYGFKNGERVQGKIRFKIKDDLSGLQSFSGYIDDEWVLFAYEPKKQMITHDLDGRFEKGTHTVRVVLTDGVGNQTARSYQIRL